MLVYQFFNRLFKFLVNGSTRDEHEEPLRSLHFSFIHRKSEMFRSGSMDTGVDRCDNVCCFVKWLSFVPRIAAWLSHPLSYTLRILKLDLKVKRW